MGDVSGKAKEDIVSLVPICTSLEKTIAIQIIWLTKPWVHAEAEGITNGTFRMQYHMRPTYVDELVLSFPTLIISKQRTIIALTPLKVR